MLWWRKSGAGDLELYPGSIDLSVDGWKNDKTITLHKVAQLSNPLNKFRGGICNFGAQCATKVCPCRKKGALCSTKCHGSRKCSNTCTQPTKENQTTNSTEGKQTSSSIPQDEPAQAPLLTTNKLQLVHDCLIVFSTSETKRSARKVTGFLISICGLQPTILKETGQWDIIASDGIQILNQTNTHWLCKKMCQFMTVNWARIKFTPKYPRR